MSLKSIAVLSLVLVSCAAAAEQTLLDFGKPESAAQILPNGKAGVDYKIVDGPHGKALEVTCTPADNGFPGVTLKPAAGLWNLTSCGKVEADVTNLDVAKLTVCLRVDNAGDRWDAENVYIPAGQSATARVLFGYSWGQRGYALDPAKVTQILVFTEKPKQVVKFRIDAVRAAGQPGEKPAGMVDKLKPTNGVLTDFAGMSATQAMARGAQVSLAGAGAQLVFPGGGKEKEPGVSFMAKGGGLWDLSAYTQAEFTLRNPGAKPIRVVCRVENRWARKDANCVLAEATLAAGAEQVVIVPFWTDAIWDGSEKKSGAKFGSDEVAGVFVGAEKAAEEQTVVVKSVKVSIGPSSVLPDWVGRRPPVPGNWTKTFEDDFDGGALDMTRWTLPDKDEASIWDAAGINSARNAGVTNGCLYLKCEKPAHLDVADPRLRSRPYLSTVVTTFDKFAQKYGYFEARMKLPTAMGMWPAFWMMPDRGQGHGSYWGRQDTKNGGMEIDIMEHLVRFGPFRYNIAMHWDGYQKEHKFIGTERIYCQADKDGFITSGLLWEPGKLTFYCNGHVVGVWQNERVATIPGYLMFTLPTGGWGTFGIVDDAKLPDYFLVDYVRVWQKAEWAEPRKP
jgi:beta-glucanase (GH16 family)